MRGVERAQLLTTFPRRASRRHAHARAHSHARTQVVWDKSRHPNKGNVETMTLTLAVHDEQMRQLRDGARKLSDPLCSHHLFERRGCDRARCPLGVKAHPRSMPGAFLDLAEKVTGVRPK